MKRSQVQVLVAPPTRPSKKLLGLLRSPGACGGAGLADRPDGGVRCGGIGFGDAPGGSLRRCRPGFHPVGPPRGSTPWFRTPWFRSMSPGLHRGSAPIAATVLHGRSGVILGCAGNFSNTTPFCRDLSVCIARFSCTTTARPASVVHNGCDERRPIDMPRTPPTPRRHSRTGADLRILNPADKVIESG